MCVYTHAHTHTALMNVDLELVFRKNPRNKTFPGAFLVESNVLEEGRERERKGGGRERERDWGRERENRYPENCLYKYVNLLIS